MTFLQTPRLNLRSFAEGDLDEMSALMANADFMRFSLGVFSREQTAAFLEKIRTREREGFPSQFGVVLRANERLIGYCGFFSQIVDDVEEIEIGYRIHPDHWGQGIATEAAHAVRDYGFDELKLPRLISLIPSGQCTLAPRSGEKWNDAREENGLPRFSHDRLQHQPTATSGDAETS